MKLVSLKHQKTLSKAEAPIKVSSEQFPYGTRLSLHDEQLQKLGMAKKLPKVGDIVHVHAKGRIESVSHNQSSIGNSRKSVELQLTHMAVGNSQAGGVMEAMNKAIDDADKDGK